MTQRWSRGCRQPLQASDVTQCNTGVINRDKCKIVIIICTRVPLLKTVLRRQLYNKQALKASSNWAPWLYQKNNLSQWIKRNLFIFLALSLFSLDAQSSRLTASPWGEEKEPNHLRLKAKQQTRRLPPSRLAVHPSPENSKKSKLSDVEKVESGYLTSFLEKSSWPRKEAVSVWRSTEELNITWRFVRVGALIYSTENRSDIKWERKVYSTVYTWQ